MYNKTIFDLSRPSRIAYKLNKKEIADYPIDDSLLRKIPLDMPSVSELDIVRHYTNLSLKNYGVDQGFYPLGSCTMKYNPKINEQMAILDSFTNIHPYAPYYCTQGSLEVYYKCEQMLKEITGMSAFSFNPFAGAHGELSGLMVIKAYHLHNKDYKRTKMLVPVTAHGTNPASSALCGFEVVEIATDSHGLVDLDSLKANLSNEVAGIMLTNPNTCGMFEKDILVIAKLVHDCGGLLYYDGANLNAILGKVRPINMGFDVMHINLHKTFSTPHGGGGPGSGPIGVCEKLIKFLPNPRVILHNGNYKLIESKDSFGRVSQFYGNFLVVVKALCYILSLGKENIANIANYATLNANYIKESLKNDYILPINDHCMHEVVFDGLINGQATTLDVAKRLLDYGYHAPTIYFPTLFHQAMMIEPTETESKETIDGFLQVMKKIALEAKENPTLLVTAPSKTIIGRVDEVCAARNPILKFKDIKNV